MVETKKISISINEELKNAIDILADGEGVSRSRLIESILINNKCRKG
jgi:metal-responsive CopG/Arc/MetJ family transcriptional regulator